MSVEQVAREFISSMKNPAMMQTMVAPGAMASGGALPMPMPLVESMKVTDVMMAAFPDMTIDVRDVQVKGNDATVKVQLTGTQTGSFSLPFPGMQSIPATGKKVSVPDAFVVTVDGDKVSGMRVDSPANGGMPAILSQLGVKMPGM